MNIGVTGGSGFIGSHVVDQLIELGHTITVLDITPPKRNDVKFVYTDILDQEVCKRNTIGLNVVYHLAAMANANTANINRTKAISLNVLGTGNMLNACDQNNVKRFIYASTEWVYSALEQSGEVISVDETVELEPNRMKHIYSLTKYMGEMLCKSFCTSSKHMDYTILRFGIPYGPRSWPGTVFYNFMNNAIEGKPIRIKGTGNQFRRFIYVTDLAKGCSAAINEVARNQIYNLPGKESVTISELAQLVKNMFNGKVKIEYSEERTGDYGGTLVNFNKAKEELKWEPEISTQEGTKYYFEWLMEQLEAKKF